MRGSKAKKIRKFAYGDKSQRAERIYMGRPGMPRILSPRDPRALYKQLKKQEKVKSVP